MIPISANEDKAYPYSQGGAFCLTWLRGGESALELPLPPASILMRPFARVTEIRASANVGGRDGLVMPLALGCLHKLALQLLLEHGGILGPDSVRLEPLPSPGP